MKGELPTLVKLTEMGQAKQACRSKPRTRHGSPHPALDRASLQLYSLALPLRRSRDQAFICL